MFKGIWHIEQGKLALCRRLLANSEIQILGQVCVNASNNDTMLSLLELRVTDGASGVHTRIHCLCHILNLVVKARLHSCYVIHFMTNLMFEGYPLAMHLEENESSRRRGLR